MARNEKSIRSTSFAATATAIAALVAMAAAAPSVRGMPSARAAHVEMVASLSESQSIRAMALAVATVARDLLAGQQTTAILPPEIAPYPICESETAIARRRSDARPPGDLVPPARLIDLPPPIC